ncbi:MAG: hypothetical protein GY841_02920 [FCB group bacterium]|nr:hypothetical protein [FCB group bacterium]
MDDSGWFKMYRTLFTGNSKIGGSGKDTQYAFATLLALAKWKKWNEYGVELEPGQLIVTQEELRKKWEFKSRKKVQTVLNRLVKFGAITVKGNNKRTVVTICNWGTYQSGGDGDGTSTEQPRNNHGTSIEQQRNINGTTLIKEEVKKERKKELKEGKNNNTPLTPKGECWESILEEIVFPSSMDKAQVSPVLTDWCEYLERTNNPLKSPKQRIRAILRRFPSVEDMRAAVDYSIAGNSSKLQKPAEDRTRNEYTDAFERFWKIYPKNEGKVDAFREWQKLPAEDQEKAAEVVAVYATCDRVKNGFIKAAHRWLKAKNYNDDPETWQDQTNQRDQNRNKQDIHDPATTYDPNHVITF